MPTAKITVKYFGMLHDIVGKRSEILSVEESDTAMDLVREMSRRNGKRFRDFVFDSHGELRSGLAFAINGASVERSELSKIKSKGISEFVILPPISGGAK